MAAAILAGKYQCIDGLIKVMQERQRIHISGCVQGVGFRPFVAKLAHHYQLSGWVKNHCDGVLIEAQGQRLSDFIQALSINLPRLAVIDGITVEQCSLQTQEQSFVIAVSTVGQGSSKLPADSAICADCLADLFNPSSHYYHYPFISCTNCGPRMSVLYHLPYDRANTSFAKFPLCQRCQGDYGNLAHRRYHAQTIACSSCGPHLSHSPQQIAQSLLEHQIVAVKSMGGFHLMANAQSPVTINRLRQLKNRPHKPFAVMLLNIASVKQYFVINNREESLLQSPQRPIVLLKKRDGFDIDAIAPGLDRMGVMLAYTPLHYLLYYYALQQPQQVAWYEQACPFLWLATSANVSGEPIIYQNQQAQALLFAMADLVVTDDRQIVFASDDSVQQCIGEQLFFIRRSRGYMPAPIQLSHQIPSILALGGYLKNTICLTRGREAFVSPYVGDLSHAATIARFHHIIERWQKWLNVQPQCLAIDQQCDYYAARYAESTQLPCHHIQHHHAHAAQVAAECHLEGHAIALILDGHGVGEDGQSWGGELLLYQGASYRRLSHLQPLPLLGGDQAAKQCWRMGVALLASLQRYDLIEKIYADYPWQSLLALSSSNTMRTSSCGRWFDAVSSLLTICQQNSYEGEAAMRLESLVTEVNMMDHTCQIDQPVLDLSPLVLTMLSLDVSSAVNYFHGGLIAVLSQWVLYYCQQLGIDKVLLAGGCFQNRILMNGLQQQLQAATCEVLVSQQLPVNDGGLSLGQAWVAALKEIE